MNDVSGTGSPCLAARRPSPIHPGPAPVMHLRLRQILVAGMLVLVAPSISVARPPDQRAHHHAAPQPASQHSARRDRSVEQQRLQAQRQTLSAQRLAAKGLASQATARLAAARLRAEQDHAHATALSDATVAAASRVQDTERNAAAASDRIAALDAEADVARRALAADAAALAPLLPVIERLSLYPSETLLGAPVSPDDAMTGLMVLRGLGGELERRARILRQEQARLAALGVQLDQEQARLSALQRHQAEQQVQVAAKAQAAQAVQLASSAAADRAARSAADAAAKAATLGDAVARIEAAEKTAQARFQQQAAQAEAARRPDDARQARASAASLAVPAGPGLQEQSAGATGSGASLVAGRVVHSFGDRTDAGSAAGITYAPPSLATVTAPCSGRVDFAGPFRSYGRMLILDCGHQYRFVLAGLDRLDVAIGQSLARGAAIGRMPAAGSAGASSGLYVQLRHGDATIDPSRFLQAGR